ncbi:MAG: hypothetical protein Q8Q26_01215 [Pseudorhodobacter sp.]|nr:hypothetical protein [Pseudorhodobacter sp.]
MRKQLFAGLAAVAFAGLVPTMVSAQDLIGSYVAYIGGNDLFNSKGQRLTEPWQILRQDRANVHKFGLVDQGDEGDPFFGNIDNRAAMETMVRQGWIEPSAARGIVNGFTFVRVEIYGQGGRGTSVRVTVYD